MSRLLRSRRGASAIEFGLWLPVVMLLLASVVDGSLFMSLNHTLARAARDGARIGAMTLEDPPATGELIELEAEEFARASLTAAGIDLTDVVIEATWFRDGDGFAWLRLEITAPYDPLLPGLSPFEQALEHEFVVLTQEQ